MPRFYLPPDQCSAGPLFLTGREAHHALRVLRLRLNDNLTILNGAGDEYRCRIEQYDRDKVQLAVEAKRAIPRLPYQVTLVQSIPKGKLFEAIVQKATELGVFRIVPLLTERVVAAPRKNDAIHKSEKWRQVAIEAIKQCGSPWLPRIETALSIQQFLERKDIFDLSVLASLQSNSRHPREFFSSFKTRFGRAPRSVCVWIGPEGDFSSTEIDQIQSAGALPASLGPLVLRTETAAMYCLSVINYELGSP